MAESDSDNNKKSLDTRQDILRAALELFSQRGYHGTSVREIAEEVGIRKSSIYNHFQGKKHLFETLLSEYGPGSISRTFHDVFDCCDLEDPYSSLKNFCQKLLKLIRKPDEQKILKIMLIEHNNELIKESIQDELFNKNRVILADFFKYLMDEGKIKKGDPIIYANEFIGPFIFMRLFHHIVNNEELALDNFADKHLDFFWNAVKI